MSNDTPWQDRGIDPDNPYAQPHPTIPLEPMTPQEGYEIHMARVREENAAWTEGSHKSRIKWWLQWCEQEGIDNLNDVTGRDIIRYRDWRRFQNGKNPENVPIARPTLKTAIDTLRVYLRHCAEANGVHPLLPEQIDPPTLSKGDHARDVMLSADRAEDVLEYLRKYEYCSLEHVCVELLWHTGMRMGGVRSIDLDDLHLGETPYIELHHRPESDTPLKNKSNGERPVAISDGVARLLRDWRDTQRRDVEDEYGREPLLTTVHGRISRTTIRNYVYWASRPCLTDDCPHDEDPKTCTANQNKQSAFKCPGSVSPHAIRRGAITHWLDKDWRRDHVSERANVSEKVIEEHYDEREDLRKMEQRRQFLDDI
ncbi:site-specific integrase [Haloferax larsenii]|uniref:Site-specific integrase n=1 Tax=Haloferax larsenii TaxID=302484 RepID=A0ABY5RBS5_HALLR|nr:site-specific integrase [Haloferax larsenii]UVE49639.1 site-specific integrase [Haloferax larsenii]